MLWGPRYTPWQKLELPFYTSVQSALGLVTLVHSFKVLSVSLGDTWAPRLPSVFLFLFFYRGSGGRRQGGPNFQRSHWISREWGKWELKKWSPTSSYTFGIFLVGHGLVWNQVYPIWNLICFCEYWSSTNGWSTISVFLPCPPIGFIVGGEDQSFVTLLDAFQLCLLGDKPCFHIRIAFSAWSNDWSYNVFLLVRCVRLINDEMIKHKLYLINIVG